MLALVLNPLARRRRKRLVADSIAVPDVEASTAPPPGYDSGLGALEEPPRIEQAIDDEKAHAGMEINDA